MGQDLSPDRGFLGPLREVRWDVSDRWFPSWCNEAGNPLLRDGLRGDDYLLEDVLGWWLTQLGQ